MLQKLVIESIEDQGDRVLLHPASNAQVTRDIGGAQVSTSVDAGGFYVIASHKQAEGLKKGDTIEYEPYGINFGWFERAL